EPGTPFGGGYYVGKIQQDDGVYALIVAPKEAEETLEWRTTGATSPGTGNSYDGLANTLAIDDADHPAAQHCLSYNGGGYNDWYMPARLELEICYRYLKPGTQMNSTVGPNPYSVPPISGYTGS